MIEQTLLSFGGVGVLAVVMIAQNYRLQKKQDEREQKLSEVVENNTKVMATFIEFNKRNR